ncbi:MAG: hypothetical protein JNJ54_13815 [Myxococcaceae bacterium]|nr:hypothetical protein [Myxococcaceae bacterium]
MPSRTSARRTSRAAELSLKLLERALEAGAFMLRLTETLTPYAVVADSKGEPSLVAIDARTADPDELEMQLVGALKRDAAEGLILGAAWAYTIDVKTPEYEGPALKAYVDVRGERPFVAYTPYVFSLGDPARLGDTHRLDAEASVLFHESVQAASPGAAKSARARKSAGATKLAGATKSAGATKPARATKPSGGTKSTAATKSARTKGAKAPAARKSTTKRSR